MVFDLAAEEAALVARRQPYARVTVVWARRPTSARPGDAAVVTLDGRLRGWVGGSCSEPLVVEQALATMADRTPRFVHLGPADEPAAARDGVLVAQVTCSSEGSLEVFVEPRLPPPHLVAVGRSPLVAALARMATAVGFEVTVVERDDPDPAELGPFRLVPELDLAKAGVDAGSYVVVATMGRYDEDAVEAALAAGAAYVGLVASARRAAAVRDALLATGLDGDDVARVRAPAGLDLGRLPHQEIAVAVLAEVVAHKASVAAGAAGAVPVAAVAAEDPPATTVDPVCGMAVAAGRTADTAVHDGVTYRFCSSGCRRRFQAGPAPYVSPA